MKTFSIAVIPTCNRKVVGSNPTAGFTLKPLLVGGFVVCSDSFILPDSGIKHAGISWNISEYFIDLVQD